MSLKSKNSPAMRKIFDLCFSSPHPTNIHPNPPPPITKMFTHLTHRKSRSDFNSSKRHELEKFFSAFEYWTITKLVFVSITEKTLNLFGERGPKENKQIEENTSLKHPTRAPIFHLWGDFLSSGKNSVDENFINDSHLSLQSFFPSHWLPMKLT